nr:uncharacterized protein LOC124811309 [Hydra vulgaris]
MMQKRVKFDDNCVPASKDSLSNFPFLSSVVNSDMKPTILETPILICDDTNSMATADVQTWLQFENLTLTNDDRSLILNPMGLLNDKVVFAAMLLCKRQFPDIKGLEDPILCFAGLCNASSRAFVQIFNDSTKGHWVTASNHHCKDSQINIYCSLQLFPSTDCIYSISKFACLQSVEIELNINNVARQKDLLCGFYAIANCVTLCLGKDPCNFKYREDLMRQHLLTCLENYKITQFPVDSYRTVRKNVVRTSKYPLYCVCRSIFKSTDSMIQCLNCNEWFHSSCVGLSELMFTEYKASLRKVYKCIKCL